MYLYVEPETSIYVGLVSKSLSLDRVILPYFQCCKKYEYYQDQKMLQIIGNPDKGRNLGSDPDNRAKRCRTSKDHISK